MGKKPQIDNLVLEGGGTHGIAFVGAVQELERLNVLSSVRNFAGSSAGAIAALLLSLGLNGLMVERELRELDFNSLKDDSFGFIRDTYRLVTKYGLCEGVVFEKWIQSVLERYGFARNITLSQLFLKTKNSLHITATNVTKGRTEIFNYLTHPGLPVYLAVRMSMSFPLFFIPIIYNGSRYIDGGLLDNYPIQIFDTYRVNPYTLGLRLDTSHEIGKMVSYTDENIIKYIESIANMVYDKLQDDLLSEEDWKRTIRIDTGTGSSLNFNITDRQINELINSGKLAVKKYFNY